jgi:hypothetical protein
LLKELEKRFDHFLNIKNENFSDGIHIKSAFLDPRYVRTLSEEQSNYAKNFIKKYSKDFEKEFTEIEQNKNIV